MVGRKRRRDLRPPAPNKMRRAKALIPAVTFLSAEALLSNVNFGQNLSKLHLQISLPNFFPPKQEESEGSNKKSALLELLKSVPPNAATPKELTSNILQAAEILENDCPTSESDVIPQLQGNWELIWTAQDTKNAKNIFTTWINPLENQSYSNKPVQSIGRSNPILPQNIQNNLENMGVLSETKSDNAFVSTQAIDLKKSRIRNVVAFEANNPTNIFSKNGKTKGRIIVDVKGTPNPEDKRRLDVKFDACRFTILDSPIDVAFPLGIIGPTGWLRTVYIDDDIRITRGHKGSVFILSRTGSK